ncbi:MAG TPA: amidohydrolase family protein [Acidimicrobiia bacterium]|nr:amidohydrolase family protein [Acidimicrobiia bacterium]
MSDTSAAIRRRLTHPVIDIDGHIAEYFPALAPYLEQVGLSLDHRALKRMLPAYLGPDQDWHAQSAEERAHTRTARGPWWSSPARNTVDLATALFPGLLYERLDELGLDYSVVYPSLGLVFLHTWEDDARRGACRALNRCNAEAFAPYADRLAPVAAIPMHTPDEAIAELEYAVNELGFKSVLCAGYVQRPIDAAVAGAPELERWATWLDQFGIDSAYDYDPVWAAAQELGVSIAFHSGFIGLSPRRSTSSYMYNHLGSLAEGQHSLAKSLFLGGVTRRFPKMNFAFLEGGVAWAAALYSDIIGHWEKRNLEALRTHLDPALVDRDVILGYIQQYAPDATGPAIRRPREPEAMLDEWAACGIERAEDIKTLFVDPFYFGCEADDPLTSTAFNAAINPFGARLHAMMGSDIAHWDVPDMSEVLEEAWEMVDHGWITDADFKEFTFANPVRFYTGTNPDYFKSTVVEAAVTDFLADG